MFPSPDEEGILALAQREVKEEEKEEVKEEPPEEEPQVPPPNGQSPAPGSGLWACQAPSTGWTGRIASAVPTLAPPPQRPP